VKSISGSWLCAWRIRPAQNSRISKGRRKTLYLAPRVPAFSGGPSPDGHDSSGDPRADSLFVFDLKQAEGIADDQAILVELVAAVVAANA
jgi:hypothetical protein